MTVSLQFYVGRLGFEVVSASPEVETPEGRFSHWVWLRSGGAELMLNRAYDSGERPALPEAARLMAHSDTCLFVGCVDLDEVYVAVRQAGVGAEPPVEAGYGLRRFSVRDPDNFEVVFQEAVGG